MWLFPWNPNSDFFSQYEIGEQITSLSSKSIWTLFKAKRKTTRENVSIFRFDIHQPSDPHIEKAKQFLKRIKTLRHPSILKYVDSNENEKSISIVTEAVTPLADYLDTNSDQFSQVQRDFSIAYGLLNVAKGLNFMNNDCQLNHNNINIYSIFVNTSGVWKIGGLEYVCSVDETPPPLLEGLDEKYTPPERLDPTKARHPGGKFAVDSWGMGCLVWECFNDSLTPSSSVKTIGKMPKPLSVHYNKLVQTSPKHRVSPMSFINNCKEADVFFNTSLLQTIVFLEEIQLIKEPSEKAKFFTCLENDLESYPSDICKNKILPDLINAFEYGEAGSSILNPIFKIGKLLSPEEYQNKLVPCIIKLYMCKDRATRSKLLQQLETYINFISSDVINNQIFPQIIQGFLDSNFTIREQTVKSMLHLAPKLNAINLNEELLKHLVRLQTRDEEGGIRANTTVCLAKIATHMSAETQKTILLSSFLRTMKDPFPPARHAATAGIVRNISLFDDKDCAIKIMPSLCHMCIDPDANVMRSAIGALKLFIGRLETHVVNDSGNVKPPDPTETTPQASNNSTSDTQKPVSVPSIKKELKSLSIKGD